MPKRRPNGDGAVRKRADGRWEGSIVVGHKDNGNPIFKSVFAKTQKELMPKLHAMINEYRDVELNENSRMTLAEWMERWLEKYAAPTVRPSTLRGYNGYIKKVLPFLGDKQAQNRTHGVDVSKSAYAGETDLAERRLSKAQRNSERCRLAGHTFS